MGRRSSNYPSGPRERVVRMVAQVRPEYPSDWPAICAVAKLRRANAILKAASAFFAAELDRPQTHS